MNRFPFLLNTGKQLFAEIKKFKNTNSLLFWLAVLFLIMLCLGGSAVVINQYSAENQANMVVMPTILPTSADTARLMLNTPAPTPSLTPEPTSTPLPTNLWQVNQLLEPVNSALLVEFKNISTGETKKGLCQSPRDPAPIIGDIFLAEVKGGYILLSPVIPGTSNPDITSKVQRFIFVP